MFSSEAPPNKYNKSPLCLVISYYELCGQGTVSKKMYAPRGAADDLDCTGPYISGENIT